MSIGEVLARFGPAAAGTFEASYLPLCRVIADPEGGPPQLGLCILGAGSFGAVTLAVPRSSPYTRAAVASKIQFAARSESAWPSDAATVFHREYFEPVVRLQPPMDGEDAIDAGMSAPLARIRHPNITQILDCFVEEAPEERVRLVMTSELAAISPDLREVSYIRVPDELARFATPLAEAPAADAMVAGGAAVVAAAPQLGPLALVTLDCAGEALQALVDARGLGSHLLGRALLASAQRLYPPGVAMGWSCSLVNHSALPPPVPRFVGKAIGLQLLLALRYMHERRMYFRDLKVSVSLCALLVRCVVLLFT